jgi:hypothetical protein
MWGPVSPGVPYHVTSAARIGVLTPFVVPMPTAIDGPIIGLETTTGQEFTFDPWAAIIAKLITSPGVVVFGLMGTGKSFAAKTVMVRLIENGRQIIVSSDPKGEWVMLARVLGGQVIEIGPGSGYVMNPLDEGRRPARMGEAEWRQTVIMHRTLALKSLVFSLRSHTVLNEKELTCLTRLVVGMADGHVEATLTGVVGALENPGAWLTDKIGADCVRDLALLFGLLVHEGALSGMFHTHTSEQLRADAPIVVIDTSRLYGKDPELKQIATACTAAWIDATLRSQDGRYRCVISEEGWDELRNPALAQAMNERLRMTGAWRVSNWLIFHELADIKQFGEADSSHRNIVSSIISLSQIKILFRQSDQAMEMLDEYVKPTATEAAVLTRLDKGVAMWHIGKETPVQVRAVAGPGLYKLVNTDAGRFGN